MVATTVQHALEDERAFRGAAGQMAGGVAVIVTMLDGVPHGATATSAVVASVAPPLLAVFFRRGGRTHDRIAVAGAFTANLLRQEDHALARRFANPARASGWAGFYGVDLLGREPGPPILVGAAAWFACRVRDVAPVGDHACFVGEVIDCGRDPDAAPLLASRGRLHGLGRPVAPAAWMTPVDEELAADW